ncbi:MAG: anhydro-N-acetylmuramic acid kinase [Cytophagaceae bacterium]
MKNTLRVLGVMSGTSLDGLDLALCEFHAQENKISYRIIQAETIAYSNEWKNKLLHAMEGSAVELTYTDIELGKYIGEQIQSFIKKNHLTADVIASHGHTIFHRPKDSVTLQIGHPATIHASTSLPVVADFRSVDVALGGQGAPLVPMGDLLLFKDYKVCINIGGIANLSVKKEDRLEAYDIVVANMVTNHLVKPHGLDYDDKGHIAKSGHIILSLYESLQAIPFYQIEGPKSLGREDIEKQIFPLLELHSKNSMEDLLRTVTEHTADQIALALKKENLTANDKVLITGGGAYNDYLISLIKEKCAGVSIVIPSTETIEFKEALIFAFLGFLRIRQETNTLAMVTGAMKDSIGGGIYGSLRTLLD